MARKKLGKLLLLAGLFAAVLLAFSAAFLCVKVVTGNLTYAVQDGRLEVFRRLPSDPKLPNADFVTPIADSDKFRVDHNLTFGGKKINKPSSVAAVLAIPFQLTSKGQLVIAVPDGVSVGFPREASQRLILVSPGKSKSIELLSIADLEGRVRIRTPQEALAYCRLLTSPKTFYYLDGRGVEVATKDQVGAAFCFGDKEEAKRLRDITTPGFMGIVWSKRELTAFGINPATCVKTTNGFEIRRTILTDKSFYDCWFVDAVETVCENGHYNCVYTNKRQAPTTGKFSFIISHPI